MSNLWAGLSSTGYWQLAFLTGAPSGDAKIYQTHNQWTSDGQWLIFRSNRVKGEAMAVNENTGEMVQVVEVECRYHPHGSTENNNISGSQSAHLDFYKNMPGLAAV